MAGAGAGAREGTETGDAYDAEGQVIVGKEGAVEVGEGVDMTGTVVAGAVITGGVTGVGATGVVATGVGATGVGATTAGVEAADSLQ